VIQTFIGLWRVLDRRQRRRLVLLQMLCVIMGFCTVGGIVAVLPFFTVLAEPGSIHHVAVLGSLYERFHFQNERDFVVALGVCFVGMVIFANAVNLAGAIATNRFALWVGGEFHVTLFDAYLHRGYQFHAGTNSSKLTSNVLYETGRVTSGLLQSGLTLVANFLAIVFIVASVAVVNPFAALSAVVGLGASYVLTYTLARRRLLNSGRTESRVVAERASVVSESFGAIKEITVLQRQDFFVDRFARSCQSIARTVADTFVISQSPRHILESLLVAGLVGIALFLSRQETGVGPWLAQLTFVGFAAYRLLPALQQFFAALVRIRTDRAAFESIAEDLRLARARGPAPRVLAIDPSWRDRPKHELQLHAVSFRYADDHAPAIRDVTLRVRRGTTVGLVGANGSGKTTLADLIAGLLVPQEGHLEVDGIVLDDSNRPDWQSNVAYVPQETFLLDASVAENIALGVPHSEVDQNRMLRAARLARLDECVAGLPHGYAEVLGERGARLSGGQRQRVAIARALYRNAAVLILDEATNALDDPTENDLIATLQELRGQCTLILITHRASTMQHCDAIVELQNGAMVGHWARDDWPRAPARVRAAQSASVR
jgi:ATP-binding cassette, subfamily B, bacterial PglK